MAGSDRVLNIEQAARMIYNTSAPSGEQVKRVRDKLARGTLRPSSKGDNTTTASAVAEYLARKAALTAEAKKGVVPLRRGEPVPGFYKDLLKDYFLAILLQRTARKRSQAFGYAVMALQAAFIVLPIAIFVLTYRSASVAFLKSAEQVAVESYLRANYDEFEIESLRTQDEGAQVHAKFWYAKNGSKRITSERLFTLSDGKVTSVDMPD